MHGNGTGFIKNLFQGVIIMSDPEVIGEKVLLVWKEIDKKTWDSWCKRCGECCKEFDFTKDPIEWTGQYCKHLKWEKDGKKSFCELWPNCYGTLLPYEGKCVPIEFCFNVPKKCGYRKFLDKAKEKGFTVMHITMRK